MAENRELTDVNGEKNWRQHCLLEKYLESSVTYFTESSKLSTAVI